MTKLSKDDYWDHLYASRKGFPLWVFPKGDYADYLLWENILKRYFSGIKGGKVLEIGSAPGEFLIQLSRRFDLAPYGVEITSHGAELNRSIFKSNNIDPNQVTQADFLSSDFQSKNQCTFDVVLSRGVIEHFTNVAEVIDKHINLLVPGGLLLVSIPHLRGLNYFWQECSIEKLWPYIIWRSWTKKFSPNFLSAKIFSHYFATTMAPFPLVYLTPGHARRFTFCLSSAGACSGY